MQIGFWHENKVKVLCLAQTQFPVNSNLDVILPYQNSPYPWGYSDPLPSQMCNERVI